MLGLVYKCYTVNDPQRVGPDGRLEHLASRVPEVTASSSRGVP